MSPRLLFLTTVAPLPLILNTFPVCVCAGIFNEIEPSKVGICIDPPKIDTSKGSEDYYQYQWWIPNTEGDFTAEGILGQFIFVSPSENLIIVRLGEKYGNVNWVNLFELIKKVVKK